MDGPNKLEYYIHKDGLACQGQTLWLIWPICNVQRKGNVDTGPGTVFTTLHFLHDPQMGSIS
jgi:hypothetical protein